MTPFYYRPAVWGAVLALGLVLGQAVALRWLWRDREKKGAALAVATADLTREKADRAAVVAVLEEQNLRVLDWEAAAMVADARVKAYQERADKIRRESDELTLRLVASQRVDQDPAKAQAWGTPMCAALGQEWRDGR